MSNKSIIHSNTSKPSDGDYDVLAYRVRNGDPIYVHGDLDDAKGRLHVALVNRLRHETGMPVRVIHC